MKKYTVICIWIRYLQTCGPQEMLADYCLTVIQALVIKLSKVYVPHMFSRSRKGANQPYNANINPFARNTKYSTITFSMYNQYVYHQIFKRL